MITIDDVISNSYKNLLHFSIDVWVFPVKPRTNQSNKILLQSRDGNMKMTSGLLFKYMNPSNWSGRNSNMNEYQSQYTDHSVSLIRPLSWQFWAKQNLKKTNRMTYILYTIWRGKGLYPGPQWGSQIIRGPQLNCLINNV